jgi:hypothetical protein
MLNELCIHDTIKDVDPSITESGWQAIISALCSSPMCRLEILELQSNNVEMMLLIVKQSSNLKSYWITIAGW